MTQFIAIIFYMKFKFVIILFSILLLSSGCQTIKKKSDEIAEKTAQEWANYPSDLGRAHLDQIRLILDKEEPDYKN